jgi:hypothetical protein
MRLIRRLTVSMLFLSLAAILSSCITINPGAFPRMTPTPSVGVDSPDAFVAGMIAAIVTRDEAALQAMMGSPFIWATWQGSGEEMAPDGAIARMQSELLQNAMSLTFVAPPVIDEWMRGIDPLDIWPADVQPVSVIGVAGLGESGQDEAILVVAQDEVGMYFWYGLLTAEGGFANQIGEPPAAIAIVVGLEQPQLNWLPTDVRQVLVLGSVGIFDGPSSLSNQIGTTARGQTFVVLGVSADGQWWAIPCPVASGTCWISANPTFVRPLDGPPPAITATPVPAYTTPTPLPPVYPTATPLPAQPERIQFAPGQERAVRSGPLWANTVRQFVFYAAAGQTPTVRLSSPSPAASFWIVGMRDGVIYKSQGNPSRDYTYLAPLSQDYLISIVAPVNTSFTLELIMPRPGPTPQPTVQPAPERISFGPGQTSAVRSGELPNGIAKQYVFRALAGQVARILLSAPPGSDANFSVRGVSDGVLYKSSADPLREWSFQLPRTQDYLITISASGPSSYMLELLIPPLSPTPTVVPSTQVPPTATPPATATMLPTVVPPTATPTLEPPTATPTLVSPTVTPTVESPTATPTAEQPTMTPTVTPTDLPTDTPTEVPTPIPSEV